MKRLRKTIRRIILENQNHFDKLIKLMSTERVEDITNALELAITLGYIGEYNYKKMTFLGQPPKHLWYVYGPKNPNGNPDFWSCDYGFMKALGFPKNDLTPNTQIRRHRTPGGFMLALMER